MFPTYDPVTDNDRLLASFGVSLPEGVDTVASDRPAGLWAPVIVRAEPGQAQAFGEARLGRLGLLPNFATELGFSTLTGHCRTEAMKSMPAFRESWWAGRRCIVPVDRISAWSSAGGRPELWQIQRADGTPMGLAGLWNTWDGPQGEAITSFCLLTLRADGHAVFGRMSPPDDEKRMPAILPADALALWLQGSLKDAERLLLPCPAGALQAAPQASPKPAWREPSSWAAVPDMFPLEWHALAAAQPRAKAARAARGVRVKPPEAPGPTTAELF